jgi:hypothetical protein
VGSLLTRKGDRGKDEAVPNFPFRDPVERRQVDREDLAALLLTFEDSWAEASGERITSTEFYERYKTGEFDSLLAMSWASHYEIYRDLGEGTVDRGIVEPLVLVDS